MHALAPGSSPSNNTICQGFRFLSWDLFLKHSIKAPSGESFAHCRSWIYLLLHNAHICSHFQYETFFFSFPKLSAAPSKTGFTPWCHSLGRSVLSKIAVRSPFRLFLGGKNINHFSISALGAFAKFRLSSVKQRAWHRLLDLGLRDQRSVLSSAIKLFCDWGQISSCSSWCFLLRK